MSAASSGAPRFITPARLSASPHRRRDRDDDRHHHAGPDDPLRYEQAHLSLLGELPHLSAHFAAIAPFALFQAELLRTTRTARLPIAAITAAR
jgi:hypothetical protein